MTDCYVGKLCYMPVIGNELNGDDLLLTICKSFPLHRTYDITSPEETGLTLM